MATLLNRTLVIFPCHPVKAGRCRSLKITCVLFTPAALFPGQKLILLTRRQILQIYIKYHPIRHPNLKNHKTHPLRERRGPFIPDVPAEWSTGRIQPANWTLPQTGIRPIAPGKKAAADSSANCAALNPETGQPPENETNTLNQWIAPLIKQKRKINERQETGWAYTNGWIKTKRPPDIWPGIKIF